MSPLLWGSPGTMSVVVLLLVFSLWLVMARLPSLSHFLDLRLLPTSSLIEGFRDAGHAAMADAFEGVLQIAEAVHKAGGRAMLTGGAVRDLLLERIPIDVDVEVYGLESEPLQMMLGTLGRVEETGKVFSILRVLFPSGAAVDVALPRRDKKSGVGHKGFVVEVDPSLSFSDACRRRDFTVNAILLDPLTGELMDPLGGQRDLQRRILRAADAAHFAEDPLRAFRALQLAARFELRADRKTVRLLKGMIPVLSELPVERVSAEWRKLLLQAEKPSLGLDLAKRAGILHALYPELAALIGTKQEPAWHPEGEVWTHTLMAVDAAAQMIRREKLDDTTALIVLLAVLFHDLGKPSTTQKEEGRIRSHGHAAAGGPLAHALLERIGFSGDLSERVTRLVRFHMEPSVLFISEQVRGAPVTDGAIRRLARRLAPATIRELIFVAEADHVGRGPFTEQQKREHLFRPDGFLPGPWLLERAERVQALQGKPPDVIRGQDLLALGYEPGPMFGKMIRLANLLRDQNGMHASEMLAFLQAAPDAEAAHRQLSDRLRSLGSSLDIGGPEMNDA